jgi:hypothetical protein
MLGKPADPQFQDGGPVNIFAVTTEPEQVGPLSPSVPVLATAQRVLHALGRHFVWLYLSKRCHIRNSERCSSKSMLPLKPNL